MEFDFQFGPATSARIGRRSGDSPMRIAILGDFSGRANRGLENFREIAQRPAIAVDIDNFDQVMKRLGPTLELSTPGRPGLPVALEFGTVDDFHPDQLFQRVGLFRALREIRQRLLDPATFAQAAAQLRFSAREQSPETAAFKPSQEGAAGAGDESDQATLERLLGSTPAAPPRRAAAAPDITSLIQKIVAPHIVPGPDPHQPAYVASVDDAIGVEMRRLLHNPHFQGLESLWRGVQGLLSRVETDESLKICLIDVTRQELADDLTAAGNELGASGLYRLLVEKHAAGRDGEPWSVLVGDFTFGAGPGDVTLLAALGAIASRAGGPFLAAADPGILGCRSLAESPDPRDWKDDGAALERWQALRRCAHASWVGLALPRFLLRAQYGRRSDAVEGFDFEERTASSPHATYLWGNPALACAELLAAAYREQGWGMTLADNLQIDDLPLVTLDDAGETKLQPVAEVLVGERAMQAILDRGLMPVVSFKDRNAARLVRFQSLADPPAAPSGPWGEAGDLSQEC
jgi:type VI secretion system protein ImpC